MRYSHKPHWVGTVYGSKIKITLSYREFGEFWKCYWCQRGKRHFTPQQYLLMINEILGPEKTNTLPLPLALELKYFTCDIDVQIPSMPIIRNSIHLFELAANFAASHLHRFPGQYRSWALNNTQEEQQPKFREKGTKKTEFVNHNEKRCSCFCLPFIRPPKIGKWQNISPGLTHGVLR